MKKREKMEDQRRTELEEKLSRISDEDLIAGLHDHDELLHTLPNPRLKNMAYMLKERGKLSDYRDSSLDYGRSPNRFVSWVKKFDGACQREMLKAVCNLGRCPTECLKALDDLALTLPDDVWSVVDLHLDSVEHVDYQPQTERLKRAMACVGIRSRNLGTAARACWLYRVDPATVPEANAELLQLRAWFKTLP